MLGVDVPARQGRHSAVHSEFLQERGQPPAAWSRDREASPSVCEDLSSTDHLHLERGWPPVDGARNGVTAPVDDGLVFVAGDPSLCDLDRPDSQAPAKLVRLEALLARQKEVLASCTKHYSCVAGQDWHAWLTDKLSQGARNAHCAIKDPLAWQPTTTLSSEGLLVSDPQQLLEAEVKTFSGLWQVRVSPPKLRCKASEPLPPD